MDSEQIHETWWNYLKYMLDPMTTAFPLELPYLFSEPHCGTCSHWFLINGEGLNYLATTSSPREYDKIINDLNGKRMRTYRERGKVIDSYRDHRFYGWCKRFPPLQRGGYSVIGFRSFYSFLSRNIPQKLSEYDFPLVPHDCSCGEWKENAWVPNFISKYRPNIEKKAQPASELDG